MAARKDVTLALNSTFDSSGIRTAQNSLNGLSSFASNVGKSLAVLGTVAAARQFHSVFGCMYVVAKKVCQ